jgi:hypothetical protein
MKVKELIKMLSDLDLDEQEITIYHDGWYYGFGFIDTDKVRIWHGAEVGEDEKKGVEVISIHTDF